MRGNPRTPWLLVMVLILVMIGSGGFSLLDQQRQTDAESDRADEQTQVAEDNRTAAERGADLAEEVLTACSDETDFGTSAREAGICRQAAETSQTITETVEGDRGPTGPAGADASDLQVTSAVARLLPPLVRDELGLRLPGDVAAYCAARGDCIGAAGTNGTNGSSGRDGNPGPSGPAGPQGPAGVDGANGRSITDVTCQEDGTWLIAYSDDTTSTTTGPCRIVLLPEPDPTEETP